jgi:hypothetical protein
MTEKDNQKGVNESQSKFPNGTYLCPKIKLLALKISLGNLESPRKYESMLARTHARLAIKIGPKISLNPHSHFIEHLMCVFKKSPRKNN